MGKQRNPWGSGRQSHGDGYVAVIKPGHPLADSRGRVMEHRWMAWEAGLFSDPELEVHHINGDKLDNRLDNLEVMSKEEHAHSHIVERGSVRNQYGTFPAGLQHSRAAYNAGRCRCAVCCQANTDYCREGQARRQGRLLGRVARASAEP